MLRREIVFCAPLGEAFFEGGQTTEISPAFDKASMGFNPSAPGSGESPFQASGTNLSQNVVPQNSSPPGLDTILPFY